MAERGIKGRTSTQNVEALKQKVYSLEQDRVGLGRFLRDVIIRVDLLKECYTMKMTSLGLTISETDFFSREVRNLTEMVTEKERSLRLEEEEDEKSMVFAPLRLPITKPQPPPTVEVESPAGGPSLQIPNSNIDYHEFSSTDTETECDQTSKSNVNAKRTESDDPDWCIESEQKPVKKSPKTKKVKNLNREIQLPLRNLNMDQKAEDLLMNGSSIDVGGNLDVEKSVETSIDEDGNERNPCCPVCGGCFINLHFYKRHLLEAHKVALVSEVNEKPSTSRPNQFFFCKYTKCGGSFTSQQKLDTHISTNHATKFTEVENGFKCTHCNKVYESREIIMLHYRRIHEDAIYRAARTFHCQICRSRFQNQLKLDKHLDMKHLRNFKVHENGTCLCLECNESFINRPKFVDHFRKVHIISNTKFLCSVCGASFRSKTILNGHELTHVDYENRPYACPTCQRRFVHKTSMKIHIRTHTRELTHLCVICGLAFISSAHLHKHRLQHMEHRFTCEICSKKFRRRNELTSHMKRHNNDRRHKCKDCGKLFISAHDLKRHGQVHLTVKRIPCPHCSMTFSQRCNMRGHVKRIHGIFIAPKVANKYEIVSKEKLMDYTDGHVRNTAIPYQS